MLLNRTTGTQRVRNISPYIFLCDSARSRRGLAPKAAAALDSDRAHDPKGTAGFDKILSTLLYTRLKYRVAVLIKHV